MSNKFEAAVQIGKGIYQLGKTVAKKLKGNKQKTTGTEVIKSVKPLKKIEGIPKYQKEIIQARGQVQKKFGKVNEGIAKESRGLRQRLQILRDEPVTKSGISKGKDVGPGIYSPKRPGKMGGGFMGKRMGYKKGTGLTRKSNVEKIKKTFGTKKGLGMQSVIYGLDKNPKITAADPKAKFIAAANKKKKKKVI